MSLYGAIRRERSRPPEPPAMAYGLLDGIPPPRRPDATVFGTWLPYGPVPGWAQRACRCGCCQAQEGPCWQCGATVTAWQWPA